MPGSAHGYDVTDHTRVREELGGERGLRALAAAARAHGLALVLDIVPNHMAVPAPLRLNRPLWEVAREGPDSPYARWFDIDWEAGGGKLLLPVLAAPLDPTEVRVAAGPRGERTVLRVGELEFPLREGTDRLEPAALLDAQWYRPAHWREARTGLNYRRFFTISELIGVRVEDPEVFAATHAKVLELVRDGILEGLRIDHVDGLADPGGTCGGCGRASARTAGWWSRRSWPAGNGWPPPGRWPGPPGTTRSTGSTGCSPIRPGPHGSTPASAHRPDSPGGHRRPRRAPGRC